MNKKYIVGLIILFIVSLLFSWLFVSYTNKTISPKSAQDTREKLDKTKIEDILKDPTEYENKIVIVNGTFGGWRQASSCDLTKTAMKTKNDTIIYDGTGCVYMTDQVEILSKQSGLDPLDAKAIDQAVTIKARVNLINDKIIFVKPIRDIKLAKLPDYYQDLAKRCLNYQDPDCCYSSVESMASANLKIAGHKGECPPGFEINSLDCQGSIVWCVPMHINTNSE